LKIQTKDRLKLDYYYVANLPSRDMKKPYAMQAVRPKDHPRSNAAVNVTGLPKIETEKSEQTKLKRMRLSGVHSCQHIHNNCIISVIDTIS
jgi:hypothetical protein